ncbi:MAG: hypothetical protein WDO16_06290 [Bacteroidota bacterium]
MDYSLDPIIPQQTTYNSFLYKLLHSADYSMAKYSITHFADFFRGIKNIVGLLEHLDLPAGIRIYIDRIAQVLKEPALAQLAQSKKGDIFSVSQNLYYAFHIRGRQRNNTLEPD